MSQEPFQAAGLSVQPGQRLAEMLSARVAGIDLEFPIFLINGAQAGPTLSVTAGIHGAEYASVEAALRLGRTLNPDELRGRVIVCPIANPPAFTARSIYITPPDGKNLNRQFPGQAQGTFSQALAHWLFTEIIQRGDAYVDLHGGDMIEALVPFVIHFRTNKAALDGAAAAMAQSFGIHYVLQGETPGSTYASAAAAGIPAILAEAGGQGIWTEDTVGLLQTGVRRVMAHLEMLGAPTPAPEPPVILEHWAWLRSEVDGVFYPTVQVGERVRAGQDLGRVADVFGNTLQSLTAPIEGTILFLVSSLAMNVGDPLLAVAG